MEADDELVSSIKSNPSEVAAIKFVPVSQLNILERCELTPWLQKIVSTDLLNNWIQELDAESTNINSIKSTKYSSEPIINL